MSAPDILIAIVNYGTPDLTCQCLASLALARPTSPPFRVVVADLCLRADRNGWASHYVPASRIVHLAGASSGSGYNGKRAAIWFQSRRHYSLKNYGLIFAALTDVAVIAGVCVKAIKRKALRRVGSRPKI